MEVSILTSAERNFDFDLLYCHFHTDCFISYHSYVTIISETTNTNMTTEIRGGKVRPTQC